MPHFPYSACRRTCAFRCSKNLFEGVLLKRCEMRYSTFSFSDMAQRRFRLSEMTDAEIWQMLDDVPAAEDEATDVASDYDSDSNDILADPVADEIESDSAASGVVQILQEQSDTNQLGVSEVSHAPSVSEEIPVQGTSQPFRRQKRSLTPEVTEEDGGPAVAVGGVTGDVVAMKNDSSQFKSIVWESKHLQLHVNEVVFRGQKQFPEEIKKLATPYECFRYFVDYTMVDHLVEQTNLYARQKDIRTNFIIQSDDIRKFVGILLYMSVYRYPNVRSYWGKHSFEPIRQAMPMLRFESIRRYLHYNDNSVAVERGNPGYDPLHKVRPLVKHFNGRFLSVPMPSRLCIDEQMCATKMTGSNLRQYMPNKPHKWGFKFFCLCDTSGFSYSFEIYTGAGDNIVLDDTPDLGAASNVVVRLSKHIPNFVNHILYFDNFYTSLGVLTYLRSRGIYSLGTVRRNRVPNCKLSADTDLQKKKAVRGYSEEFVGNAYGIDITSVLWNDTKPVRLLSTYVGVKPLASRNDSVQSQKVRRWDRQKRVYNEIDCPQIIKDYNRHMGGVDLMDGLLGRYRIHMKTRKWSNRIFYHLIDVAVINAYLLYHRIHPHKEKIELPMFRTQVAESLCLCGMASVKRPVGRPSSSPKTAARAPKRAYLPTEDIRYDQMGHWCVFRDRTGKKQCKFPKCTSETQAYCIKCDLSLCNSTTKTCFYDFHNKQ